MKIPTEWEQAAVCAWDRSTSDHLNGTALVAAIAAVAPMIAAAERERCAKLAETHEWFVGGIGTTAPGSGQSKAIAAAIRLLKDTP